jgi:hypothetical protein
VSGKEEDVVTVMDDAGAWGAEAVWLGWNLVPGAEGWEQSREPVVEARRDPDREPGVEFPLSGIVVPIGP